MKARAARALALVVSACGLAGVAGDALATPPEPPLSVSLRLLSADPSRGRYRIEVRLGAGVALEDAALVVRLAPRGAEARTARAAGGTRESRETVSLRPGRELRRELDILTGAQEPVTLLVGLGGRAAGAQLHRTRALDLGPETPAAPRGRVRTDQLGREYYEVPMQGPR